MANDAAASLRIWVDERFCDLSPSAKVVALFFYSVWPGGKAPPCCPYDSELLAGLFRTFSEETARRALQECHARGVLRVDEAKGLVYLDRYLRGAPAPAVQRRGSANVIPFRRPSALPGGVF